MKLKSAICLLSATLLSACAAHAPQETSAAETARQVRSGFGPSCTGHGYIWLCTPDGATTTQKCSCVNPRYSPLLRELAREY